MCKECHVVSLETELKDLESIQAACRRLGWSFMEGQQTYRWYGRWMDDSPIPERLFSKEQVETIKAMSHDQRSAFLTGFLGKCDHAIRVPGAPYEIGLMKIDGQYVPVWDWYSSGGLDGVRAENGMAGFLQAYGVEQAKRIARRQGQFCYEIARDDGSIEVHVALQE